MRVLCVGRHPYLSEHLCRYFSDLGAHCEGVVGTGDVVGAAAQFEPHIIVSDSELVTTALLDGWSRERALADVPVLAVSLTRRPEDGAPSSIGVAGVVYLPALQRHQVRALLDAAYHPRGVHSPASWPVPSWPPQPSVVR